MIDSKQPPFLFGAADIVQRNGLVVRTPDWDFQTEQENFFARGHFPCHQSMFVSRQLLLELKGFDKEYAIAGDYKFFLQLSCNLRPQILPFPVARFVEGGASSQHWIESWWEFHRARKETLSLAGSKAWKERMLTSVSFARAFAHRFSIADKLRP